MSEWWKEKVVYQIYPMSFMDSNGDGIGDLKGIISKLDYLSDLGVGILWLSPVYTSPNYDNGYDVADYRNINPEYGTMDDMDLLIQEADRRGLKIVMDLVVNHTSIEHEWFEKSRQKIEPYRDYYIWRDEKPDGSLPNNWTTFFAEDAWTFDNTRKQYYLHLFAVQQPDLNWHNPNVMKEVKDIMTFWLDKGVVGFRCDVINILFKTNLEDGKNGFLLKGIEHYLSQKGNHQILKELRRDVLDSYDAFTVGETVLVTPKVARKLSEPHRKELNMLFSFEHMEADQYLVKWFKAPFDKRKFLRTLVKWQTELSWNANYFENHDQLRSVSRFGNDKKYWKESASCLATLLLSLKGSPFIYQGQEIGMTQNKFESMSELRDIESFNVEKFLSDRRVPKFIRWRMIRKSTRDHVRTPMQWNTKTHAGFTTNTPWIDVNKNYSSINVSDQKLNKDSILSNYKQLIHLRNSNKTLIYGDFELINIKGAVFKFKRSFQGDTILVIINFSRWSKKQTISGTILYDNYHTNGLIKRLKPYHAVIYKDN